MPSCARQDGAPLSLGQELSGYVEPLAQAEQALPAGRPGVYRLAIGGTAVGTGLNTHPQFAARVCELLASETKLAFSEAPNKFAALGGHEALVFAHGAGNTLAAALFKIANDVRLLSSGPRSGCWELRIPEDEPAGSVIPR